MSNNIFNLDIDGDNKIEIGKDGVILLRYLGGLRGDALIADINNLSPIRNTATAIETYISGIIPQLDIDDDGNILLATG